jgi:hypothetical protein
MPTMMGIGSAPPDFEVPGQDADRVTRIAIGLWR